MYKLTKHTSIIRLSDNANIPADPSNRDYADYLEWLAEGNTPEPVPPKTQDEIAAEESAKAKRELADLDLASIPMLRAYIAAKADAPQELKGLEAAAALKKAKVK